MKNRKARGKCEILKETEKVNPLIEPTDFMKNLPISTDELKLFLSSETRVKRLKSIEKFKDFKIVVKVVSSKACISGHKKEMSSYWIHLEG